MKALLVLLLTCSILIAKNANQIQPIDASQRNQITSSGDGTGGGTATNVVSITPTSLVSWVDFYLNTNDSTLVWNTNSNPQPWSTGSGSDFNSTNTITAGQKTFTNCTWGAGNILMNPSTKTGTNNFNWVFNDSTTGCSWMRLTLTNDIAIGAFTGVKTSPYGLRVIQDASGGHKITSWNANYVFPVKPDINTNASAETVFLFVGDNSSTKLYCVGVSYPAAFGTNISAYANAVLTDGSRTINGNQVINGNLIVSNQLSVGTITFTNTIANFGGASATNINPIYVTDAVVTGSRGKTLTAAPAKNTWFQNTSGRQANWSVTVLCNGGVSGQTVGELWTVSGSTTQVVSRVGAGTLPGTVVLSMQAFTPLSPSDYYIFTDLSTGTQSITLTNGLVYY